MPDKVVNIKTGKAVSKNNRTKTSEDAWRWRALMKKINEEGWGISVDKNTVVDKTLMIGVVSILDETITDLKYQEHLKAAERYRKKNKK